MISSARLGDKHVCPLPGHGTTPIASASADVTINVMGAARIGDTCGCGAVITGSGDTFGGFVMEATPGAAIINFAALGVFRPDGSIDDETMATLLADPNLTEKAVVANALVDPHAADKPRKRPSLPLAFIQTKWKSRPVTLLEK